jgi:cytidine deaminase
MTILEELIELGLKACENGRNALVQQPLQSRVPIRGAALLAPHGKVFTGCDVLIGDAEANGICAERSAILSAVAEGIRNFEVSGYYHFSL